MAERKIAQECLAALGKHGAGRARAVLTETLKQELNVERGRVSLFRTTANASLAATAIVGERRGSYSSNRTEPAAVDRAAAEAVAIARACPPDPAYEIAESQPAETFAHGPAEADRDLMYERLRAFLAYAGREHPHTIIGEAYLSYNGTARRFLNSNGVDFTSHNGYYQFTALFTSKKGGATSSFNYTGYCTGALDRELWEYGSMRESLSLSGEEIGQAPFRGKFDGAVVIAPDALGDFIGMFCYFYLTDPKLVAGTSALKDSLDRPVAVPELTLRSVPLSPDLSYNYFHTQDGYKTKNTVIIERGTLKTFLLSLYGARKTGKRRADTDGGCFVLDPGSLSRDELLRSVGRGLYVRRVSGGMPNDRGDFSFVAKNSFLIEGGALGRPVNEAMISGNLFALLKHVTGISRESVNFGSDVFPWVKAGPLVISGK